MVGERERGHRQGNSSPAGEPESGRRCGGGEVRRENAIHGALGESKAERTATWMDVGIMRVSHARDREGLMGTEDGSHFSSVSSDPPAAALI